MYGLHKIRSAIYVPTAEAINAALDVEPIVDLLGPFTTDDAGTDAVCARNTIYLSSP